MAIEETEPVETEEPEHTETETPTETPEVSVAPTVSATEEAKEIELADDTTLYINEVEELVGTDEAVNYFTYTIELDKESIKEAEITYPLIIDPDIATDTEKEYIEDTYISSLVTNPDADWIEHFKVGYRSDIGINRSYVKMTTLPPLAPGDMVVGASLVLYRYFDENRTSISYDKQINIHEVTESWPEDNKFDWGDADIPAHNSRVESTGFSKYFDITTNPVTVSYNIFDITNLVKAWYSGEKANNGVMIKNADESANGGFHEFFSSQNLNYQDLHPYISVLYVNSTGIESTYSYHELAIGRAGTAYINDATGNVTLIHEDCTSTDGKMPIQLSHVFDNNYRGKNVGYGVGWRLNYDQSIEAIEIDGDSYYKYVDGDGTIHYFYKDGDIFYDEGNKQNKLTISGSNVIIEDTSAHIKYTFANGKLCTVVDANGNSITINRNSAGYISEIYDPEYNMVSLTYSGNLLDRITCPNGEEIDFNYVQSFLTEIVYPDGKKSTYAYYEWCMGWAKDIGGYKVVFDYNSTSKLQVSKATEYANDVAYSFLKFSYKTLLTTVTDIYGRTNHYRFNNYGQLINEQDYDGSAVYYDYEARLPGKKNNLSAASDILSTSINLVSNSSFENNEENITSAWQFEDVSTGSGTQSTWDLGTGGYIGEYSLYLLKLSGSLTSKVYTTVNVTPGKTYTVSLYYKGTMGADLYAEYTDASGNAVVEKKEVVYYGDQWFKNTLTVSVPSNAGSILEIGIYAGEDIKVGAGYIDAVQVSETGTATRYNLIKNPDFSSGLGCWAGNNLGTSDTFISSSEGAEYKPDNLDDHILRITGEIGKTKSLYQLIAATGVANDSYIVGAFAKANGIPKFSHTNQNTSAGVTYGRIILKVEFQNGSTTVTTVEKEFSQDTSDWQYLSLNAKATAAFTRIKLSLVYDKNLNTAYFDGVSLYKDGYGTAYTYDSKNNLEEVVTKEGKSYLYVYDDDNNLSESTDEYDNYTKYYYDDNHNVEKVQYEPVDSSVIKYTEYNYDDNGNIIGTYVYDSRSTSKKYVNTSEYTGNYKTLDTDSRDCSINYTYDSFGRLSEKSGPKEAITYFYSDDNTSFRVATDAANGSVMYAYNGDNLSKIFLLRNNSFYYAFDYNAFGQLTNTYVKEQVLCTNTYDSVSKQLTSTTYGNGHYKGYQYNGKNQLTKVRDIENYVIVDYEYNDEGALSEKNEYELQRKTMYDYDDKGRFVRELTESTGAIGGTNTSVIYTYDDKDRVNLIKREIGDESWTETYEYDDGYQLYEKVTTSDGVTSKTTYDVAGRILERSIGENREVIMGYDYENGTVENSITSLVNYSYVTGQSTKRYTYDSTGLITKITASDGNVEYSYDNRSQLKYVEDYRNNTSTQYFYDDGGNITRKIHTYDKDDPVNMSCDDIFYEYDDTWTDLLISYGGKTITYDTIGNPTKYLDHGTFSWSGRNLDYIQKDNSFVALYAYDVDGLRREKVVDNTKTEYIYTNGQLSAMKVGEDMLYFTYDSNGLLVSVKYNDTIYYYLLNPQGDVVGLCNENGATVATYKYNEWGKHITQPTSGIGALNPFRYRGYIYDAETGFYYLGSRYYDPEVGRFINADDTSYLGYDGAILSYNLFAYGLNNPVNNVDINGCYAQALYDWAAAMWWLAILDGPLPVGEAIYIIGLLVLSGLTVYTGVQTIILYANQSKSKANSNNVAVSASAGSPMPPNKNKKGTNVTSKTLYTKFGKEGFRIDVENPLYRAGQIHMHKAGAKYFYDIGLKLFRVETASGAIAPRFIQKILSDPDVIRAINKGLEILGY